jgi:hypothetical protein
MRVLVARYSDRNRLIRAVALTPQRPTVLKFLNRGKKDADTPAEPAVRETGINQVEVLFLRRTKRTTTKDKKKSFFFFFS